MQNFKPIITNDGSHTFYVPEIDECYHSTNGAIQESRHIFIDAGLKQCEKAEINLLEIGFGTGLNALLTAALLEKEEIRAKKINYTTIELYPLSVEEAMQLNYPELIAQTDENLLEKVESFFEKMHTSPWGEKVQISEKFLLTKLHLNFTQYEPTDNFDVIYFDAFSPEKQPEMWSEELFKKLYLCAAKNAVMTTYSAKGAVRRAMQSAGFRVERISGPPGKREILRAKKLVCSM